MVQVVRGVVLDSPQPDCTRSRADRPGDLDLAARDHGATGGTVPVVVVKRALTTLAIATPAIVVAVLLGLVLLRAMEVLP